MQPKPNYANRNTLGKIARKYCVDIRTLESIICGIDALKTELDKYLENTTHRGQKILTPLLVDKIFAALGEP